MVPNGSLGTGSRFPTPFRGNRDGNRSVDTEEGTARAVEVRVLSDRPPYVPAQSPRRPFWRRVRPGTSVSRAEIARLFGERNKLLQHDGLWNLHAHPSRWLGGASHGVLVMTEPRPRCACRPTCTFRAAEGHPFHLTHDPRPERQAERAELMRLRRMGRKPIDFASYRDDPVLFTTEVLDIKPWHRQAEIMAAVAKHDRVAVRSGHKIGKSTAAGALALWWVMTRHEARVVLVAPTARQIRSIVWRELKRLYRRAKRRLGGTCHDTPDRGLQFPDDREVIGVASDQPERVAGYSGPEMLFILDEASGITEELYGALVGNLAGGGHVLLLGNPTRTSGFFFDAFNRKEQFWHCMHVSAVEAGAVEPRIPGLASPQWCAAMELEWGQASPLYQVRVLGDFPTQQANAVIGLEMVEAAVQRAKELRALGQAHLSQLGPLECGLDPARFGDDESVLAARRGSMIVELATWHGLDGVQLANAVMEKINTWRIAGEVPVVRVDVIGVGASAYDQLKQHPLINVDGVDVGEAAIEGIYARKRDELWFRLRDAIKNGGALPDDARLVNELVAPTFTYDVRQKLKVESKDSLKTRLKRSPDRADAVALAFYSSRKSSFELWGEIDLS